MENFAQILELLKEQEFIIREGKIAGDDVVLIYPSHIGVEWTKENLIYRSSIWTLDGRPISLSFKKFVNFGEKPDLIPDPVSLKDCVVISKIDGSTGITSKYKGEFIFRTRGTFDARILDNGFEVDLLLKRYPNVLDNEYINSEKYSVIYEWVSPNNKIILDYGPEPDLFLTAIIKHNDYTLLSQDELDKISAKIGVQRPRQFRFSDINAMLTSIKELKGQEGCCVYFNNGQDIKKVKSDEYLKMHRFKSQLSPKNILELFFQYGKPDYETFMKQIETDFDYENAVASSEMIKMVLRAKEDFDKEMDYIKKLVEPLRGLTRAEAARAIMSKMDKSKTGLAFNALDGKDIPDQKLKDILLNILKEIE
jgi:hypothetical protein